MTRVLLEPALAVILTLAVIVTVPTAAVSPQEPATPTARLMRLERWVDTMLRHQPGEADEGIATIGSLRNSDLRTLGIDARVLVQLIRYPLRDSFSLKFEGPGTAQRVRYTPDDLHRLRQLACAVGGVRRQPECALLRISIELDAELKRLSERASVVRVGDDDNFILRRGALLHADIAMLGLGKPGRELSTTAVSPAQIRIVIADGQETDMFQGTPHWEIARLLLDEVKPVGSPKPDPGQDEMVRQWDHATAAWMEHNGHHETNHLIRAREIFPDDADLLFLTGCEHETYASAATQTAVQSAVLPTGVFIAVGSERAELRLAERYLRRAVEVNTDFVEARLRLGRVLALLGRPADAASELRKALASTSDNMLIYFGEMFLGVVEETLGDVAAAKASYERAATLYPLAQSPKMALSELARRSGDRDAALKAIQEVFALRLGPESADPWWTYHIVQARRADALVDELRRPFMLEAKP